jgi:hypothetical protein
MKYSKLGFIPEHAGFQFFKTKLNIHTHIYEDKKMNKQLYKTQNNCKKAFK